MASLEELTARCEHLGRELHTPDLSRYELIDHATALTVLCASVQRVIGERHAVEAHSLDGLPEDAALAQEVSAARATLHDLATRIRTAPGDEVRTTLLDVQTELMAVCLSLSTTRE